MRDHTERKSLSDCQTDAVYLFALLRGMSYLSTYCSGDPDADEGLNAMIELAREKAGQLAENLDRAT